MNINKIVFGILSVFLLTSPISYAQEFNIPPPTCVSVPGIPCPGESAGTNLPKKKVLAQPLDVKTDDSKAFKDLLNISNLSKITSNIINQTTDKLRSFFDIIFNSIKDLFKKNKS